MKVLQINTVCGVGSTGRIATDIHNILLSKNYDSYIAYGKREAKNCNSTIKIGKKIDIYAHAIKTRVLDLHGFGSKDATRKFINTVEELNPDIIHLHNIHGYYVNIEILFNYLKKIGKPIVWTLHDCWCFTGHCAYFDYVGCEKWKSRCYNCPETKAYPKSIFRDNSELNFITKKNLFTGLKNLTIVTPSRWLAKLVKQSFLKEYPVEVINNGIDLQIFKPKKSCFRKNNGIDNSKMILGVASTWDRRKGLEYFIDLSSKLEKGEIIVLVGLNEKQIATLPKNIIGISRTNNATELAEIYTAADIFVNPTLEEVFGMTNIEALACGTPVITFDTGGSPECIDDTTGLVVEKGNKTDLLSAIERMNIHSIDYNSCINRAKVFDKNVLFQRYIEIYEENVYRYKNN